MPIVEIAHWAAVKNVKENGCKLLKPALETLKKQKGCLGVRYGFVEEHHKLFVYLFVVWDKYEDHAAFMKQPDYPGVLGIEQCISEGGIDVNHVEFTGDFNKALNAPVMEVSVINTKKGTVKELVIGYIDTLAAKVAAKNVKYEPTWGTARENDNRFYVLIGWDSVDAHKHAINDPNYFHPFDDDLKAAASLKTFHIHLEKEKT
ncbi:hypothetical protein JR316_0007248 [Psilocybe cubensis]|uniref:Uncharacterized protein n=2 Tax=Psilocybe cubensis TaxID=181762 RepID=A0ACB8GY37_PSICU|nr:hypothetical protein JR316_0007248 [Psilocybe cubensis]KAH9480648.1 hypothetical protein JR316_0007248 [Psilocybe cubensis]